MFSFTPKYRGTDYLEQWERVKRWYQKVLEVEKNIHINKGISIEEQEDYIYAFFQNLYHFKDWVKVSTGNKKIEELFSRDKGSLSLQITADFVINIKHFANSKTTRIDSTTYFVSRDAYGCIGTEKYGQVNKPAHIWWVQSNGQKYNVYKLARDSFNEVEAFLLTENLLP